MIYALVDSSKKVYTAGFRSKVAAENYVSDRLIILLDSLVDWATGTRFEKYYVAQVDRLLDLRVAKLEITKIY